MMHGWFRRIPPHWRPARQPRCSGLQLAGEAGLLWSDKS